MAASLVKVLVHVVFSTKQRSPCIDAGLSTKLYPYIAGIVRQKGATLLALGGMPDHVHGRPFGARDEGWRVSPGLPPRADQIPPFQGDAAGSVAARARGV